MKKVLFVVFTLGALSTLVKAQEAPTADIDPSKPTNLYTQVNTLAELNAYEGFNTYGTRFNVQYAFDPDNLLLVEVPLLYNDATNKFGLSDVRVRYFNAIKRNISKTVIAIAPFADISIPTGSVQDGLGADTWSLAAGAVVGLVLSEKISLFPGANYVYLTAIEESGFGFQTNMSIRFNQKSFLFVNPIVTLFSFDTIWQAEVNYNQFIVPNKFKVNAAWNPNFTNNLDTFRVGATFFL